MTTRVDLLALISVLKRISLSDTALWLPQITFYPIRRGNMPTIRYRLGWTHVRDIEERETTSTPTHIHRYSTQHRWRSDGDKRYKWHVDDDPMFNATWEDWERWYRRMRQRREQRYHHTASSSNPWSSTFFTQGSPQEQVYLNNYHFVAMVALIAVMGGVGQATRAQEGAASRKERIDKKNAENSEYLKTARENGRAAAAQHSGKKDRIRKWVREREGYADGEPDGRTARRDEGAICASNDIKERDQPSFWRRPPERATEQVVQESVPRPLYIKYICTYYSFQEKDERQRMVCLKCGQIKSFAFFVLQWCILKSSPSSWVRYASSDPSTCQLRAVFPNCYWTALFHHAPLSKLSTFASLLTSHSDLYLEGDSIASRR